MLAELGDQVGQGVHQVPCMNCTASWHRHGLPRGTAGGGQGNEGEPPQLRQRARKSVGPSLGLGSGIRLSCLVLCML